MIAPITEILVIYAFWTVLMFAEVKYVGTLRISSNISPKRIREKRILNYVFILILKLQNRTEFFLGKQLINIGKEVANNPSIQKLCDA